MSHLLNNITILYILILLTSLKWTNGILLRNFIFLKQLKNLNCSILTSKTIQPPVLGQGATFCTISCVREATKSCSCSGWTKSGDICKMCYECKSPGKTSPLTASYVPYDPKLDVDLYHSFDSKSGPFVGTEFASFSNILGTFVAGKKNNALRLAGNSYFAFAIPTTECAQTLHLCHNGITYTFWLKISKNATGWTNTMTTPKQVMFTNSLVVFSKNSNHIIKLHNKKTAGHFDVTMAMKFDEWVHYAVTWHNPSNAATVYENGLEFARPQQISGTAVEEKGFGVQGNSIFDYEIDEFYVFKKTENAQIIKLLASV